MKKEVDTCYVCEMCGYSYNNPDDAMDCEALHVLPMKENPVIQAMYLRPSYHAPHAGKYPFALYIMAQDGKTLKYELSGVKGDDK